MDVNEIPLGELLSDRAASALDADLCRRAIAGGLEVGYGGKKLSDRLESNERIIVKIDVELKRRNVLAEDTQ